MDRVLELLSLGLGLEGKTLKESLGSERIELEMKINFYPPCPQPELALGVEPHTDMSALTFLVQNDVQGLQFWKDGNWVAVNFSKDDLFVHIGDQIEVLGGSLSLSLFISCLSFCIELKPTNNYRVDNSHS